MNKTIMAVRAVAAEFGARLVRPLIAIGVLIVIVLHGIGSYLTTVHAGWWALEAFFIFITLLFMALAIASQMALRILSPKSTREQKHATREFVDKFERVTGSIATPKFVLLFRVVKDSVQKRENGFIVTAARDSTTLHKDFANLCNLF